MLTFTDAATNLLDTKRSQEAQKRGEEELQSLLDNFVKQLSNIPSYATLQSPTTRSSLKSEIKAVIVKKTELPSKPSTEETDPRCFTSGKYDVLIFSENPKVTAEFQAVINKYNREFIMRLFARSQSTKQLDFWIGNSYAKLPNDSVALAVVMGCNVHVLQYLDSQGRLEVCAPEDKIALLKRAKRFQHSDGFAFLEKKFSNLKNSTVKTTPS